MVTKKSNNRPNSNFRQQDSTARKLESNYDTVAQKQFAQTATIIEGAGNQEKKQGKLQKQFTNQTNHSVNEFRQPKNTTSKIERTLQTGEQQHLAQSSSVLIDSSAESNRSFSSTDPNKNKLQKQFSNQVREEFRKQENTASKIDKFLQTEQQQNFAQSTSKIEIVESNNQDKLRNQFAQDYQAQETKVSAHKNKLQKKFSDQARESFKKQESTASKIDNVLQTKQQQKFTKSAHTTQTSSDEKSSLEKPKNSIKQKKYRLRKELAKGSLSTATNALKSGVEKYQKELEKDDEAVKFTSQSATYTAKLSKKAIRKLREKRLESVNLKKAKENPLYKENPKENPLYKAKPKKTSLKKISKTPVTLLQGGAIRYQKELEKDDEAVKLVSQSTTQLARATKKLSKGVVKISERSGKLGKQETKLTQFRLNKRKNKKLQLEKKAVLKKKAVKKKLYYAPKKKDKAVAGLMSSFSNRISAMFKNVATFNRMIVTRLLGAKVAAWLGSGLAAVLPLIMVAALVLVIVGVMGGSSTQNQIIGSKNLSPEVEQWRSLVETEAAAQGMENYIGLILAIIQVETGGTGTRDIMQSSESAGFPRNYWSTEEESVRQGIKHLKNIVNIVRPFGLENNYKLLAQAYNFGSAFAGFVVNLGGDYSLDVAERYSRDVVAPSLGNHSGERYSYVNETSKRLGKTYLYRNGGNFMYGELVAEYLGGVGGAITGDFAIVVAELEKYLGWSYVWGGKNPSTGFDCSGFVSWGLAQIGINLPSYAASQYDLTVPIDPSEAQPGDLIFFKGTYGGPNHVSHVGFYIDENTMLDSNGSGVGYHNWKDPYWQKHYAGIRRIASK